MIRPLVLAAVALVQVRASLPAQGTLSTQGFGYPPGQFSPRVLATGGALAELDAASPINPAALGSWGRFGLFFQYAPEFRTVSVPGAEESATIVRFPTVGAIISLGQRWTLGLSASTLLDRTWEVERTGTDLFGADSAHFTETFSSSGAINDVRLAAAWVALPGLRVALGAHALTGENRLQVERVFQDPGFAPFSERSSISYDGSTVSAGIEWIPTRTLGLGVSARGLGRLRSSRNDTTLSAASVPPRFGFGIRYSGIAGANLAAGAEWHEWSQLRDLAASELSAFDSWAFGVGAEVRGPRWFGADVPLRAGLGWRSLPFGAEGNEVRETSYAFGLGVPLAQGRASTDFTVRRATRDADGEAEEVAWTLSFGLNVRP